MEPFNDNRASLVALPSPHQIYLEHPARALLDRVVAGIGLVLLSPVLLLAAAAILLEDGWPVLFRQQRVGQHGVQFQILKLRSMYRDRLGARITASRDPRITRTGRLLRKYKLDELPQLWNVLKGEMSLVGPRPEVPSFVDLNDPAWETVLRAKPGITDLASLLYRQEEEILAASSNPEKHYSEVILPEKLLLNAHHLRTRTIRSDLRLVLLTIHSCLRPSGFDAGRVKRMFLKQGNA